MRFPWKIRFVRQPNPVAIGTVVCGLYERAVADAELRARASRFGTEFNDLSEQDYLRVLELI